MSQRKAEARIRRHHADRGPWSHGGASALHRRPFDSSGGDAQRPAVLYVDARCGVSPEFEANLQQDDYLVTNCSVAHGGSGQLLLERAFLNGRSITGLNGRPQLSAYGIFQASVPDVDMGAPNLENESMGVAPFTKSLRERIEPFLLAEPFTT